MALYRELHPSVLRYLRAQAPKDGDDLASQVWVDAAAALVRFTGDESDFRRWRSRSSVGGSPTIAVVRDAGGSPPIGLRNHLRPTT